MRALLIASMVFSFAAFAASHVGGRHDGPAKLGHECVAPCTVVIGDRQEDEFGLDYGWRSKHVAVVDVYGRTP